MSPSSNDSSPASARGWGWSWARTNLFGSAWNTVLTLAMLAALAWAIPPLVRWAVSDATLQGLTRRDCTGSGACWAFIRVRFERFFFGSYPAEERWRILAAAGLVVAAGIATAWAEGRARLWLGLACVTLVPVLAGILLAGGILGLTYVPTGAWGGLMLNVLLTVVAGIGSFLLGIPLAFGRRSSLPALRLLAILFIEFWRGVPLLTALFMALLLTPFFLPQGVTVDNMVRAIVALTLFNAAYMAETIRGGLQAVPRGQSEAASALGLHDFAVKMLIVLPQALRLVIPGIVNIVIDLFKDTTLVSIVGLFDILGIVNQASRDPAWLGMGREGYAFAALVFFCCCFAMSLTSRRLERRLAQGVARQAKTLKGKAAMEDAEIAAAT